MSATLVALLVGDDPRTLPFLEAGLRGQGWDVRTTATADEARGVLLSGGVDAALIDESLVDEEVGAFAGEVRAILPLVALLLIVRAPRLEVDPLSLGFDDVVLAGGDPAELDWRLRMRRGEVRRLGLTRERERFLRGVVRVADLVTPHADVPTLAATLAPALLALPGVEGVRVEIDAEAPGDPPLVVLEIGRLPVSGAERGTRLTDVPLRGLAGGRVQLSHRGEAPMDGEVRDALGAIVGTALSGARLFAALKDRQLRLERGYVDRHRKLSRVSTRLERLSEARDSFLALLSHDLRSPLAVVLGQVQLVEEGFVPPGGLPKVASTIRRQGERMLQMVEDLLDRYRRDDAVRSVSETGDAARIVSEMVENLRPLAEARQQSLRLTAPSAAPIETDIAAIREVLANLLENAVRHSPVGSTIDVEVTVRDARAVVTIRDAGPGFGASAAAGGSGAQIGLRASTRIVADAGGSLRTATAPGGGGLAVISLPAAIPQATASAIELLVGDPALREHLFGLLSTHWEVRQSESLDGAFERMRRQPPAVILLDQRVGPEAIAFLRRLKADAELAAAPVIALGDDAHELHDAGALAVLRVPVDGPLLLGHVRRALRLLGELPGPGEGALDVLTGLPTARALNLRMNAALEEARESGTPLPVVQVRVDELKRINHEQGWLVGDQLLLWLATRLRERVRPHETVARTDAETFALALPGRTLAEAEALAAELRDAIGRARPRLGVARVEVRVSARALDLTTLALGGESLVGAVGSGRES